MFNVVFITLITTIVTDLFWLNIIAKRLYTNRFKHIIKSSGNVLYGFISYGILASAFCAYAVIPALASSQATHPAVAGMMIGFVIYAVNAFSNLAAIKDWTLKIAIIDIIWGTLLGGISSFVTFVMMRMFFGGL